MIAEVVASRVLTFAAGTGVTSMSNGVQSPLNGFYCIKCEKVTEEAVDARIYGTGYIRIDGHDYRLGMCSEHLRSMGLIPNVQHPSKTDDHS